MLLGKIMGRACNKGLIFHASAAVSATTGANMAEGNFIIKDTIAV